MYPNQGQPPFGSGGYNPYPGSAPPYGGGQPYPNMPQQQPGFPQQPFGSGYPPMPQPGMPQPFNYQSPPTNPGYPAAPQANYPSPQQPGFPPQQPPSFQPYGQAPQAAYPQAPIASFGMGTEPALQQHQQAPSFGAPPQQGYQPYGAPPQQQHSYGAPPPHQQPYGAPQHQQPYGQPPQQVSIHKKGRPTVVPAQNFNASNDAATLRKAMKGFGTDEDALIEVLCRRTNAQRMDIVRTYKTCYGKDLADDIRSETSGNFEKILVALLTHSSELYARELFEAMYGEGTDEDVLIEVMCTMSNQEIREISGIFHRMFGKNLEHELRSDTSGTFKRLMTSLSCGNRDESMVTDINQARIDAQELKRAGVDKWGTDESTFNRILCLRNYEQIKLIAQEYEKLSGNSLEKDIKREFSGDIEDGLLSILRVAHNRHEFFARRLHKSMAGIGTNDSSLIRLVVTRCEIDMVDIKEEFQRYYGKSLKSFIKGDTSGHYKHALYALIGENRS